MKILFLLLTLLSANLGCSRETGTTPQPDTIRVDSAPQPAPVPAARFTTIRVDTRTERLALFLHDDSGKPFHRFDSLSAWLAARNQRLIFAMNAGMYEPDFSPVGLLVQDGRQISPLNTSSGRGNFYLKPNGVFLISPSGPRIVETSEYAGITDSVYLATQSGPLLLRNGIVHPEFNAASTSRFVRNGVGISGDTVMLVISEQPVTFYELALYFRDDLGCLDALYLDGAISSLYSVELNRNDYRTELGPMIGVVRTPDSLRSSPSPR